MAGVKNGHGALASSVDVGWHDGKPRRGWDVPMAMASRAGVSARQRKRAAALKEPAATRIPRPRSKNAPKPALLVDYGIVTRNETDAMTLQGASGIEQLALSNAETAKQFESLALGADMSSANHHARTAEMQSVWAHSTAQWPHISYR